MSGVSHSHPYRLDHELQASGSLMDHPPRLTPPDAKQEVLVVLLDGATAADELPEHLHSRPLQRQDALPPHLHLPSHHLPDPLPAPRGRSCVISPGGDRNRDNRTGGAASASPPLPSL